MMSSKNKRAIIALSIACGLLVLSIPILVVTAFSVGASFKASEAKAASEADYPIIDLVNEVRAKNGAAPLKEDSGLDNTAKIKANDMAARNYWDHTDPDGVPFQVLLLKNRPGLKFYGENLAECFTTNKQAVDAWVASPGHFANMINSRFNVIGSYVVWDEDKQCAIVVNHFGQE